METKEKYTDQEIRNIISVLDSERACVKNLRRRIQELEYSQKDLVTEHRKKTDENDSLSNSVFRENEQLKTLLKKERNAFRAVQDDLDENSKYIGQLQTELAVFKGKIEQERELEGRFKSLEINFRELKEIEQNLVEELSEKTRLLDAQGENADTLKRQLAEKQALLEDYTHFETNFRELEEIKQRLVEELSEKTRLLDAQGENADTLKRQLAEKQALLEDYAHFETNFKALESKRVEQDKRIEEDSDYIKSLQESKEELEKKLSDEKIHSEQLEKGVQYLRARMEEQRDLVDRSVNEAQELKQENEKLKEFESSFEEAKTLRAALQEKLQIIEKQGQVLLAKQQRLTEVEEELLQTGNVEELKLENMRYQEEKGDFERRLKEREAQIEEKKRALESKDGQIAQMQYEGQKHREFQAKFQAQIDEKEMALKTAQQHLAKKMKDLNQMKGEMESLKSTVSHQNNRLENLKHRSDEHAREIEKREVELSALRTELHQGRDRHHRELEQKEQAVASYRDKIDSLLGEISDLKVIKDKYNQLQAAFSKIGSVFETPMPTPAPTPAPAPKEEAESELFAAIPQSVKVRTTFFDE